MGKEFTGSWVLFVILLIFCWPGALIYFFVKYEERAPQYYQQPPPPPPGAAPPPPPAQGQQRTCMGCGQQIPVNFNNCPHCGKNVQ